MILRYVSRVLVCKLHPSRAARYFQRDVFNNKSTLSRPLLPRHSSLPLLLFPSFAYISLLVSPFLSFPLLFPPSSRKKAFCSAVENALHSRPIILWNIHRDVITRRSIFASAAYYERHFTAASLNYGVITSRRIIKKLSRPLSAPLVVKARIRIDIVRSHAYQCDSYKDVRTHVK